MVHIEDLQLMPENCIYHGTLCFALYMHSLKTKQKPQPGQPKNDFKNFLYLAHPNCQQNYLVFGGYFNIRIMILH